MHCFREDRHFYPYDDQRFHKIFNMIAFSKILISFSPPLLELLADPWV